MPNRYSTRLLYILALTALLAPFQNCSGGYESVGGSTATDLLSLTPPSPGGAPMAGTVYEHVDPALQTGAAVRTVDATAAQILASLTKEILWVMMGNPWGVTAGAGHTTMNYSGAGDVTATVKYTGLNPGGVLGYPFLGYGADPFGFQNGGDAAARPQFPMRLDRMQSLVVDLSFKTGGNRLPDDLDVAFDNWLIPRAGYADAQAGSVEIMIMYYYKFAWLNSCAYQKSFAAPAVVDGEATTLKFDVYGCLKGPGTYIMFVPVEGQNRLTADIRMDILPLMNAGAEMSGVGTTWLLAGLQFGTEWGNPNSSPDVDYWWTLKRFGITQLLK